MAAPVVSNPAQSLRAFRQRIDAFFRDPRATLLVNGSSTPPRPAPPTNADGVLRSPLADTLRRLGFVPAARPRLRRSLTMHDGRVVAITGGAGALAADEAVRVVTVTTTVLEANAMRTETAVLVFETARDDDAAR
jgi:hypothetical protein